MSDKSATEALHRLGVPIPFPHPIHPPVRQGGGTSDCPVCGTRIEPLRCCQECSQVFGWAFVEEWLKSNMERRYGWPPLPKETMDEIVGFVATATSGDLVIISNRWKNPDRFACLIRTAYTAEEHVQQRSAGTWKCLAEAELDRRAARGIEDE